MEMAPVSDSASSQRRRVVRVVVSVVACLLLLGAAGGASYVIFATEPTAESEAATRRTAALVETVIAERGVYRPRLEVLGVVEPAQDVVLGPRVSGQVIAVAPRLVPGGVVRAGQELLRIDPADFERALTERLSELRQVEAELAIEEGRQQAARQEFELLGEEIDAENRALVLREPQIAMIRAQLLAAEAAVEQAQLDLDRATVTAPFDAQVLERTVDVGSQVAPGDQLARLVGVAEYWVIASVPLRNIRWLRFAQDDEAGSAVQIRHTTAWGPGVAREGEVARLIGAVDQQTRLARVLVTVPDPLGRESGEPPIILGTIVQLQIEGEPVEDVVRLERDLLRQSDTVWVKVDGALEIRPAEVVFRDAQYAYIRSGVEDGEEVVTTSLATVTEGLALRTEDEPADGDAGAGGAVDEEPSP